MERGYILAHRAEQTYFPLLLVMLINQISSSNRLRIQISTEQHKHVVKRAIFGTDPEEEKER